MTNKNQLHWMQKFKTPVMDKTKKHKHDEKGNN